MGQSFGNQFILVDVTTDASVRGIALRQRWIAAAKPEQAVTLVLSAIPEGWAASLTQANVQRQNKKRHSILSPAKSVG